MNTFTVAILISLFACVEMWPRGAPNSTCDSMMPGHGKPRQSGPSPYTLTLSKTTYRPNENIQCAYMDNSLTLASVIYSMILLCHGVCQILIHISIC